MKAADLMTRDVITVGPETSLREVASVLATEHIGGVPVAANDRVLGVVSASDLVDFAADTRDAAEPRGLQAAGLGAEPEEAAWGPESGEEGPGDYFTGLWEDSGTGEVERFVKTGSPEADVLDEHTASEVMTRNLFSVALDTGIEEAARRMLEAEVHRALVIEEDRLVGILTAVDILRAVAEVGLAE